MASNTQDANFPSNENSSEPTDCSVCLRQPPVNAIQLKCGHIFCYMCAKGAVETTGRCPLCRDEIGIEFNFQEHEIIGAAQLPTPRDGYYWFFEGYQGWWLYDSTTNRMIDEASERGETNLEVFTAGFDYVIDLCNKTQRRKDGTGRTRKICRATLELENIKGIAGLKGQYVDDILDMMKESQRRSVMS